MLKTLSLTLLTALISLNLNAQQDSAKYTDGALPTIFTNVIDLTDASFGCTDTLMVTIPAGNFVTSVDVYYSLEASNGSFISNQGSFLECLSTATLESLVAFGPAINASGVQTYSRTGLNIANGISATGEIEFFLHAFRNADFLPNLCSGNNQSVVDSTWRVIVHHIPAPTCLPPAGLVSTAKTTTSITLDWTTGGATNWQIEYGQSGFAPGTGTVLQVATSPYTVTALLPSTDYEFRVQDSCGVGDVSLWTAFETFKTQCTARPLPYSENFNTDEGCFAIVDGGTTTASWFHEGNIGQALDGTGYMRVDSDVFGNGETLDESLESPPIDASSFSGSLLLDFDHFFRGVNNALDSGKVQVYDGTNWNTVYTVDATIGAFNIPDHQQINITAFANANLKVRFVYDDDGGWAWYWNIDNFSVRAVSCFDASNLGSNESSLTSAEVFWTTGGAANWNVEYGAPGYSQGSGTLILATNDTISISGLSSSNCYDFYVQDSCAPGDVGAWVGPFTFCTLCTPTSAPWSENFDGASWSSGAGAANVGNIVDFCWPQPSTANPNFGTRTGASTTGNSGPTIDVSGGGKYLYTEASNGATGAGEISSPFIIIPTSIVSPELRYSYHMFGANITSLEVQIKVGVNGLFTSLNTIAGQQQTAATDAWLVDVVSLVAYSGDTVTLKFIGTNADFAGDIAIDEVSIDEAPTCLVPSALGSTNPSAFSTDVFWTTGGAAAWNVEYGAQGFSQGSGTLTISLNDTLSLAGLNASTCYDFYVRDSCGLGDVGTWVGPFTFCTLCSPLTAPWTENFDGATWTPGAGGANNGNVVDNCWTKPDPNNPNFGTRTGGTVSGGAGPSGDFSGAGNYIYTEASNGATGAGEINSPLVIIPNTITVPQLAYYYHMFGNAIQDLEVFINNGSGFTSLKTITGQQQTASTDPWLLDTIDLSSYSGDTVMLKFVGTNTGFNGDIAIDEVEIREKPTCLNATNLDGINITATTVDVFWTTGGASAWNIEYGTPGFAPGGGTLIAAFNDTTTITGLSASTCYDVYVRDSCAPGDVGVWEGPFSFCTACNPFNAPWSENFDGGTWTSGVGAGNGGNIIDVCWTRPSANNPNLGTRTGGTGSNGTGPSTDVSGAGNYLYGEASGSAGSGEISSPFVVVTSSLVTPVLEFSYHMAGFGVVALEIQIDNGSGFGPSLKTISGPQQNASTDPWLTDTLDLSAFSGDTIVVKFIASNNNFAGDIAIDEVSIDEAPTCNVPSLQGLDVSFSTSANVFWTTGGATAWQVEYGVTGFVQGTGNTVSALDDTLTLQGLIASTCYDFYVRDSCGPNDYSAWVGPFNFCTSCAPLTAPWTENFDGTAWNNGAANNALGTIDNCWFRTPITLFSWKTGPPPNLSTQTGPSVDHTTGSDQFIYSERLNNTGGQTIEAYMYTPPVDVSALTAPELSFWYHMFGNSVVGLEVDINAGNGWTNIFTRIGQQNISGTDPWLEAVIDLSTYANDTVVIRFLSTNNNGGTNNDVAIDDVSIDNAASCPDPQNFEVLGFTNTTVTLAWTSGGAQWNIEYGTPGFAQGTGTQVLATNNPFTVTGLSPNTSYDFYVRDSCGPTDQSNWVGSVNAETDCNPLTAPFIEDFDGTGWVQGTAGGGPNPGTPGTLDACWRREPSTDFTFTPGQNGTPSNNTGPSGDHTSGNGQYIYSETYYDFQGFNPNVAIVTTPLVDVSSLVNPELKFFYHMFGGDITDMEVRVFNGSSWTSVLTLSGQLNNASADPWLEAIVDLVAFAGDTIKVEFTATKAVGFSLAADMAIDDLSIDEKPACPKPSNLITTSSTNTTIDLSWTSGGASNWQIEYGPSGFAPGSGTIIPVNSNPFTVTALNPSTAYDFYIQDSCGIGSTSDWVGPTLASTLCAPIPAPYSETFDGGNFSSGPAGFGVAGTIDACWTRNTIATYFWKAGPSTPQTGGTGPSGDHTSGSGGYLFTESGGFAQPPLTAETETPEIDLSPLTLPELKFWYHMFGPNVGDLVVEITNNGGSTWSNLTTITGQQQTGQGGAWLEAIVDLSIYANDTVQFRFTANKTTFGNQSDIAIDDIGIDEAPACPKPLGLQITNTTATEVTLSWTTGGATDWQIEYGATGFASGSGTVVNVNTNPFTINSLTPNTGYDFYVRDSCGLGSVSDWSSIASDTTDCTVFTAPFTENFDGSSFVVGGSFANPGEIDPCWERIDANTYFWAPEQNGTLSNNTGPSGDHTTGAGKFMFSDGFGQAQQTELLTPNVDLSPLTSPELRFWYHMYGGSIDKMEIEVWNGSAWVNELTLTGQSHTASSDPWTEAVVNLSTYVNDTIQVRFIAFRQGNTTANDMALDDVWIGEATTCARPDSAILINATTNSLSIQWNNYSGIGSVLEYRPAGSTGPFITQATTGGSATLSGLSPSTIYEVFIRDSCGLGDLSLWTSGFLFSTLCGTITAPWAENFDGAGWTPGTGNDNAGDLIHPCWTRSTNTLPRWGTKFGPTISGQTGPITDVSGSGQYIYTEATIGTGNVSILSPSIAIPVILTSPVLEYSYHMFGAGIDSMLVEIDGGSGFTTHKIYAGQQQNSNFAAWLSDTIDLTPYLGNTIQIRFVGINSTFRGDIAVDGISITGQIAVCNEPTAISFTNIGNTSAEVNWTSNSGTSELEVVPAGQPQGSGTMYSPVTSPFTLTSLLPLSSYDVYIRDICGTQFSNWEDSTFTTSACPAVAALFTSNATLLSATFDASSSTGADTLVWDFGDGNSAIGPATNVANAYANAGTYTITLIAYNSCGNADTIMQTLQVCDSLVANFNMSLSGDTITYDAASSFGANNYRWDFGDGTDTIGISSGTHKFIGSGTFIVKLTVYNDCGDSASTSQTTQSCGLPVADWTYSIISTTSAGMQVQFDGTQSLNAVSYDWDFGDGNTNTVSSLPVHTYIVPSLQYTVSLKVTNACGDVATRSFRLDQISLAEQILDKRIFSVYPNPSRGFVNIALQNGERVKDGQIEIFDVTGKKLIQKEMDIESGEKITLKLNNLPKGHYTIRMTIDGQYQHHPLVIH